MCRSLLKPTFLATTVAGLLALQGCSFQAGTDMAAASEYAATGVQDEQQASDSSQKRPSRRARASLSMPYFSFAQSLNPRS